MDAIASQIENLNISTPPPLPAVEEESNQNTATQTRRRALLEKNGPAIISSNLSARPCTPPPAPQKKLSVDSRISRIPRRRGKPTNSKNCYKRKLFVSNDNSDPAAIVSLTKSDSEIPERPSSAHINSDEEEIVPDKKFKLSPISDDNVTIDEGSSFVVETSYLPVASYATATSFQLSSIIHLRDDVNSTIVEEELNILRRLSPSPTPSPALSSSCESCPALIEEQATILEEYLDSPPEEKKEIVVRKKVRFCEDVKVYEVPKGENRSCTDWHKNLTESGMARATLWQQELAMVEEASRQRQALAKTITTASTSTSKVNKTPGRGSGSGFSQRILHPPHLQNQNNQAPVAIRKTEMDDLKAKAGGGSNSTTSNDIDDAKSKKPARKGLLGLGLGFGFLNL